MSIAEESHEVCQLWPERSLARGCVLPFRAKVEGHLAQPGSSSNAVSSTALRSPQDSYDPPGYPGASQDLIGKQFFEQLEVELMRVGLKPVTSMNPLHRRLASVGRLKTLYIALVSRRDPP